jgi:hypothetical protein
MRRVACITTMANHRARGHFLMLSLEMKFVIAEHGWFPATVVSFISPRMQTQKTRKRPGELRINTPVVEWNSRRIEITECCRRRKLSTWATRREKNLVVRFHEKSYRTEHHTLSPILILVNRIEYLYIFFIYILLSLITSQ